MSRKEIKARAKAQLGNHIFGEKWLFALLVCLISSAISGVCNTITGIGTILSLVVAGPLSFGVAYCFLKQTRDGEKMEIGDMFKGFTEDFKGNLVLGIMQSLFVALWSILFVIPGCVKGYAYSMAFYIKNDHPEYDWRMCLSESQRMMYGHKMELFVQDLSFIGWLFVGSLCFGVGALWVTPYMTAARTQFYDSLLEINKQLENDPVMA